MSNSKLIRKINELIDVLLIWDMGDGALDAITGLPNYRKWLDAGHGDDYLKGLNKSELKLLLKDIESI